MLLQTSSGTSTKFRTFLHLSVYHIDFTFESHPWLMQEAPQEEALHSNASNKTPLI